jgi:hypothetical protein
MATHLVDYGKAVERLLIDYPNLATLVKQEQDHTPLTAQPLEDRDGYFINEISRAEGIFFSYVVPADCLAKPEPDRAGN